MREESIQVEKVSGVWYVLILDLIANSVSYKSICPSLSPLYFKILTIKKRKGGR